ELALAVEAAALVLEPRAARTGRVAWDKRHRRHGRPFSGRRVRIRRGRGCRARTKERGTEMEAPPRRFAPSWGHEKTLSLGQHPRLLIQQEEGACRPLPLLIRRERGSLASRRCCEQRLRRDLAQDELVVAEERGRDRGDDARAIERRQLLLLDGEADLLHKLVRGLPLRLDRRTELG